MALPGNTSFAGKAQQQEIINNTDNKKAHRLMRFFIIRLIPD